jgi:diguanylate cyclase (GGDEF)-like protein
LNNRTLVGREVRGIRLWWRQPDHFDWLSDYLAARRLTAPSRYVLAAILVILAAATLLMLLSPSGPQDPGRRMLTVSISVALFAFALVYSIRWPKRIESQVFSISGSVAIAAACLAESDPRSALLGCAAFAGLAGYVAFFHSARYLLATLVIALGTATVCAVRIAMAGDAAMAVAKLLLLSGGILAVPFCSQLLVHWLSVDAVKVSTDALTGLRNRRGFHRSAHNLIIEAAADAEASLTVVMIDLDGFKRINDTYGHATGDTVLTEVAARLRKASRSDAVVARIGGEEFVVAETSKADEPDDTAERIRSEIAATSWGVTASLGVSRVALTDVAAAGSSRELLDGLITTADTAMYEAKRAGGNQIRIAEAPITRLT